MNMREKLARALVKAAIRDGDWDSKVMGPSEDDWPEYLPAVDDVLKTLREPTEAMLVAAKPEPTHLYGKDGRGDDYEREMKVAVQVERMAAASVWQAMIDAALACPGSIRNEAAPADDAAAPTFG